MKTYNKLIRDKIPEIIKSTGKQCNYRILNRTEYDHQLSNKLKEELEEFLTATSEKKLEEIADLVEVIHAIVEHEGFSVDEFDKIRLAKKEERGGFKERLYLESVE